MVYKPNPFPLPAVPPEFKAASIAEQNRTLAAGLYRDFFKFNFDDASQQLEVATSADWERQGVAKALAVFHAAAERVPAYKDFLKREKINHKKIKTLGDFQNVPVVNKENYLLRYSLQELSWDGFLHTSQVISVSSGSTGNPFFWPRGAIVEIDTAYQFEVTLGQFFNTKKTSTLFVNAFAMGMYVGGPITLNSVLRVAQKGHQIVIVTPGYSLEEIRRIVHELGPQYEQVVIGSYPPFAKDIIDDGIQNGISWKNLNTKFWLAGEGYSESWRDYIAELAGASTVTDVMNVYGTADSAMLGHETPTSIAIRRVFDQNNGVRREIFADERLPSLVQYYPSLRYFEVIDQDRLIFTASSGIPLVRYDIGDRGGIFTYDEAEMRLNELGTDIGTELRRYRSSQNSWRLPFVYVFGRSDSTTVFYGANIYPENIKIALETSPNREEVTGKFTMLTEEDTKHDQQLVLNIECGRGTKVSKGLARSLEDHIVTKLLEFNSEYGVVHNSRGKKSTPDVRLHLCGDNKYFGDNGVKHKWTL